MIYLTQQVVMRTHSCIGATLTSKEKLDIARQLSKLGVDIIEAGFPVASPDDFEAVRGIAMDVGNAVDEDGYVPVICGLSRCVSGSALLLFSVHICII